MVILVCTVEWMAKLFNSFFCLRVCVCVHFAYIFDFVFVVFCFWLHVCAFSLYVFFCKSAVYVAQYMCVCVTVVDTELLTSLFYIAVAVSCMWSNNMYRSLQRVTTLDLAFLSQKVLREFEFSLFLVWLRYKGILSCPTQHQSCIVKGPADVPFVENLNPFKSSLTADTQQRTINAELPKSCGSFGTTISSFWSVAGPAG